MWWFRYHVRRLLRPLMKPMDERTARRGEMISLAVYIFVAWNLLGIGMYKLMSSQNELPNDKLHDNPEHADALRYKANKIVSFKWNKGLESTDFDSEEYKIQMKAKYQKYIDELKKSGSI